MLLPVQNSTIEVQGAGDIIRSSSEAGQVAVQFAEAEVLVNAEDDDRCAAV